MTYTALAAETEVIESLREVLDGLQVKEDGELFPLVISKGSQRNDIGSVCLFYGHEYTLSYRVDPYV